VNKSNGTQIWNEEVLSIAWGGTIQVYRTRLAYSEAEFGGKGNESAKILLLLWRAWHLRNDVIRGKGNGSILGSVKFLVNYSDSLKGVNNGTQIREIKNGKGKMPTEPGSSMLPRESHCDLQRSTKKMDSTATRMGKDEYRCSVLS
jgi:hypothetical protein